MGGQVEYKKLKPDFLTLKIKAGKREIAIKRGNFCPLRAELGEK